MIPKTKEELFKLVNETTDHTIKFSRTQTGPDDRIILTALAEQNNFSTFIEKPLTDTKLENSLNNNSKPDKSKEFLVITQNVKNFPLISLNDNLWDVYAKLFSDYVGIEISKKQLSEAIDVFGLKSQWDIFTGCIQKYGLAGYRRCHIILADYIINQIKQSDTFLHFVKKKPRLEKINFGKMSKMGTVVGEFYNDTSITTNLELASEIKINNPETVWVTIDAKHAIFQGYRDLNIIDNKTCKTWKDFISQYTSNLTIIDSRLFRLSIFGKLNNKMKVNTIIINNTIIRLWNKISSLCKDVFHLMEGDEVILKCNETNYETYLQGIYDIIKFDNAKISCFKMTKHEILTYNNKKRSFYVKRYIKNKYSNQDKIFDVKCIEPKYRLQAYKLISDTFKQ
jgi:hypothetical protein